jgi:UDP-N-acetylglucosamine 2-epimerase (non-hydrolysing)
MSPIIRELEKNSEDYFLIHTGQHYSFNMDKLFFEELELPVPQYNLNVGSESHAVQTAKMLIGLEKIYLDENPSIVLVQGDTNSVLAGALAAAKLNIPVGHVEAGLRSYDRTMPEETNRVMADHISEYLFVPTITSEKLLLNEGIAKSKIFVTGNTIVDAVKQNMELAKDKSNILDDLDIEKGRYFLSTFHRQENVDNEVKLRNILDGLNKVSKKNDVPVIVPLHPRTQARIKKFNIDIPANIKIVDPVGYLDFLNLESSALMMLTDSGGMQEEGCILKIPCVTLRENTERPETIDVGSNILAGTDPERIDSAVTKLLNIDKRWNNPFGDGNSGKRIVEICKKK